MLKKIKSLNQGVRFDELRKEGCNPITIPKHEPIKVVYVKMVKAVVESEESGFVASYPELPGCISCGETIALAVANIEDAKREWLLAAIEDHNAALI